MDYSCPKKSLESLEEAEMPFEEDSFLTTNMKRNGDGIITQAQFDELIQRAKDAGRYIPMNSYSFETLSDSIHREFCYAQQRYIFYTAAYQESIRKNKKEKSYLEKANKFNKQMLDLITSLQYMDYTAIEGKQAPLVQRTDLQTPFAFQAWFKTLSGSEQKEANAYEKQRMDILKKEMENAAGNYSKETQEEVVEEAMSDINTELQLRQDQVHFTREKNRYATLNLSLYTFANLAAVGLLLYFFRSKT
jgi:hypothetical protein